MSFLSSLSNQVAKLREQVPHPPDPPFSFKLELFNEQEQERIAALQTKIGDHWTGDALRHLTNGELYEMQLLIELADALETEDLVEIQRCRATLATHQEEQRQRPCEQELIARFLSIDTALFKTPISPGGPIGLVSYETVKQKLERGVRLTGQDWKQLEHWIHYAEEYPAAIERWNAYRGT